MATIALYSEPPIIKAVLLLLAVVVFLGGAVSPPRSPGTSD
jgi:hypothetical protein